MSERGIGNNILYFLFVLMTGFWITIASFMTYNEYGLATDFIDEYTLAYIGFISAVILIVAVTIRQIKEGFIAFSKVKVILGIIAAVINSLIYINEDVFDTFDTLGIEAGMTFGIVLLIIWTLVFVINIQNDNDVLFDDHCEVLTAIMFGAVGAIPFFIVFANEALV